MAKPSVIVMRKEDLRFVARLLVYSMPLFFLVATGWQLSPLMSLTQHLAFAMMQATGVPAVSEGALITVPVEGGTWAAYVSWDSSGWKSILLFFALVMATEAPLRKKAVGLALMPLLYAANATRVWFMFFFVHNFGLDNYELIHGTLWSWGMIAATLAVWLFWRSKATEKHGKPRKQKSR